MSYVGLGTRIAGSPSGLVRSAAPRPLVMAVWPPAMVHADIASYRQRTQLGIC